jgi:hypothetical protein
MLVGTANVGRDDFQDNGMIDLAAMWVLELGISDVLHFNQTWFDVNNAAIFAHGTSNDWSSRERQCFVQQSGSWKHPPDIGKYSMPPKAANKEFEKLGSLVDVTLPTMLGSRLSLLVGEVHTVNGSKAVTIFPMSAASIR